MARFETAMDIGQKFWTIASYALYRDGKRMTARRIEEHEVQEIRIFGNEENDIAYCYDGYMRFSQSDIGSRVFLTEDDAKQEADLVEYVYSEAADREVDRLMAEVRSLKFVGKAKDKD